LANYTQYIPQTGSTSFPVSINNCFNALTIDITALETGKLNLTSGTLTGILITNANINVTSGDLTLAAGNIIASGTVDGRDIAVDGTQLDANTTSLTTNIISGATLLQTLDNPNAFDTPASDNFGISTDISGNNCIVGAWKEDETSNLSSGKAYIFNVSTGALLQTLDNPNAYNTATGDKFGRSVAIDGNNCIVGAYFEDDVGGTGSGKAYIFNVSTGALLQTLDNPNAYNTSANDRFGLSASISGDTCAVGAYFEKSSTGSLSSGICYIFKVSTGELLYTLDNPNTSGSAAGDRFGWSVSIDGDYAVSAAYLEDDGGNSSGTTYIYNIANSTMLAYLTNLMA